MNANTLCGVSCPQLAVSIREHTLVAAPVRHAEGGHSGEFCRGEGGAPSAGALLRRLGPHASDCGSCQGPAGPLLQNHRGKIKSVKMPVNTYKR